MYLIFFFLISKIYLFAEASNGTKLTVKPTKIVAGLEATKTNEFLQALGKAIKKYVKKILTILTIVLNVHRRNR